MRRRVQTVCSTALSLGSCAAESAPGGTLDNSGDITLCRLVVERG